MASLELIFRWNCERVDEVYDGYVAALLWAGLDWSKVESPENPDGEPNPEPFDEAGYTDEDISHELEEAIRANIDTMLLTAESENLLDEELPYFADPEQFGHDFYLTRNHHGVGFWDRGLGETGLALTELAQAFGETNEYVGDDGKIYPN